MASIRLILAIAMVTQVVLSAEDSGVDTPNEYYDQPPDSDEDLDIRMPPSIEIHPLPVLIYRSDDVLTLECEAIGTPDPVYHWYRNNAPLDENSPNINRPDVSKGTIRIDPATSLDEGFYQCFAENQYGKAVSDVAFLQRATISPYPQKPEAVYNEDEGNGLKVMCDITKCVPKPSHNWVIAKDRVDENPISVVIDDRVQMDDDGNLYFANVKQGDHQSGKLYKCIAYNAYLDVYTGGSYSIVNVNPTGVSSVAPLVAYQTPTPTVGLVGEKITLKCLFSGIPVPNVSWKRKGDKKELPMGRHDYPDRSTKRNTELELSDLHFEDEGEYVCSAESSAGSSEAIISLDVQAKPTFADFNEEPGYLTNVNATNNDTIHFNCNADGEPVVGVEWFINGDPMPDPIPARMSLENDEHTLVISELCKTCPGLARKSDLMVVQCNASNDHGYIYSSGYINVLLPTELIAGPESVELVYYQDMVFTCEAKSDPSTLVAYSWLWNGSPIHYEPGRVQQNEDGSLRLITKNEDDGGKSFEGEYTCVASNGYSEVVSLAQLSSPAGPVPVKGASMGDLWWVFLIVALILLLLILLLCCCLCCQRNRGDTYPVDEKERRNGNDPEKELANDGYADYQRPEDEPVKGSRASLTSTIKLDSDEEGSLAEYGDIDAGKFNEDGSFIGQYSTDKRKRGGETNV